MKIVIVGAGYWGKNLIRTFNNLGVLAAIYDLDTKALEHYKKDSAYSKVEFGTDYTKCLQRWDIDGVVVATPPNTHYSIASEVLSSGKHVFIEKPMTLDEESSTQLVALAEEKNKIIMVGHIFLYSPEILKLKEIISAETFGDICYAYTQRLNLGKIQECGVIMDLAPHDVSILDYLLDDTCEKVKTVADSHVIDNVEDVSFITLRYKKGTLAHLHLSWLDPLKVRNTVVVGTKQMVVCDSGTKKIDIYNTSVDFDGIKQASNSSYGAHLLTYTYGDVVTPFIPNVEPMRAEAEEFLNCMKLNKLPLADGSLGLSVVKTIVAMKNSLKGNGKWQKV